MNCCRDAVHDAPTVHDARALSDAASSARDVTSERRDV